jgi:polar amino acid transport system ATP-binding protein
MSVTMREPSTERDGGRPLSDTSAVIEVAGLRKHFGDNEVLRGIDLTVRKGEVVSVLGKSGGGKSTLLRCMNLLETPTSGSLTVCGLRVFDPDAGAIRGRQLVELRRRAGMLFQGLNVFPTMTVIENVAVPMMRIHKLPFDAAVARGIEMLDRVGIAEKYRSMPAQLSGGQLQRVALARALALNPMVLLFDEPTSALDPESTIEVLEVMKELSDDGMTMVVVTHEVRFALRVSDTVVFMHQGTVLESAPPDRIVASRNPETRQFLTEHLSDGTQQTP